jgi:hypothetical protein
MSETDDQLKSEIQSSETRGEWGAWAVVAGLALEIVLATANSFEYRNHAVENWGAVVADCLIAIGVYVEIHFGRRASHASAELRRRSDERVAAANERAAEANKKAEEEKMARLKLAKKFSARTLSDDDVRKLREALRGKISRLTVVRPTDMEANLLGYELLMVFRQAGIDTTEVLLPIPGDGYGYPAGIYVMYDPDIPGQQTEAHELVAALADVHLGPAISGQGTPVGPTGLPRFPEDIPFPWVYIGLKWPMRSGPDGSGWRFMTPPSL